MKDKHSTDRESILNKFTSAGRPSSGFSRPTDSAPIGVPIGIEFLGRPWSEGDLLRIAYVFEQATRYRRPPQSAPPLQ